MALIIALGVLVLLFFNPEFRPGVLGVAVWFVAGLGYFTFHTRHRLVASPEEAFAVESNRTISANKSSNKRDNT